MRIARHLQQLFASADDDFAAGSGCEFFERQPDPRSMAAIVAGGECERLLTRAGNAPLWPAVPVVTDFRKNVKKVLRQNHFPSTTNILVKLGGLGDVVQLTAVAKALKAKDPQRPIVAIVKDYGSLLARNPYINGVIECGTVDIRQVVKSLVGLAENVFDLRYISRAYGSWANTRYFYDNLWYYEHFPHSGHPIEDLGKHVCDLMLHSLGLQQYATCGDILVCPGAVPKAVPGDYVVVCNSVGSLAGALKRWTDEAWDGLIKWLHSRGLIPVQLGTATEALLHPGVMDLRGRTTPRQAAGYLQHSRGYIGVEGGLFHLAKAVGVPAVVIFAATSPTCFAYPDTHAVTRGLCRPCWWSAAFAQAKCIQGRTACLNLPAWPAVAAAAEKMLAGHKPRPGE